LLLFLKKEGLAFLLALTLSAHASAAPNGKPQHLIAHRPTHTAPPSLAEPDSPAPDATPPTPKPYSGTPIDVLTYHYDNGRTGWNRAETDLTVPAVKSANFTRLTTLAVDGLVLAQPLLVSQLTLPDGSRHDVLFVATEHNTLYAYDANTYKPIWIRTLGRSQSSFDLGCGDVVPELGISATPVIVRHSASSATLYVVTAEEPSAYLFHSYLRAIDAATGRDVLGIKEIAPSGTMSDGSTVKFDPQNQWARAGLAANNGSIYVSIGGHCDNNQGAVTGWELRYFASNTALANAFHTINTPGGTELASIWMTGFAPAIDASGNVFLVTGNGDFTKGQKDWGQSALKLLPNLTGVLTKFTPADYDPLNAIDADFGAGGIMLLPKARGQTVPPLAVAMGKAGILYLLNQEQLGNENPGDSGALQAQQLGDIGLWGGPAYYDGPDGPTVFVQIDNDVLRAFRVATTGAPSLTLAATGTTAAGYGGSLPVVASNGGERGVVWLIRRSVPMELEAYDSRALGKPLRALNAGNWYDQRGNSFVTPLVANGRVYAGAYRSVAVFGLKQ
jgi:outer membrane protein assembly factor BamB